ncbi:uncharacterized protein Pyn_29241 [Prunus yedoensis var. nudiflora]|uniref:EF-hand domain-containing protein n=1 Tax=Prunus yedoensis var. nudiflora TaxID=2094558 RepID=A0A314XJI3_PRUYE|nr:uncharacterized protein Pyn_25900 [Prunus yedoensis var. nudiflora]PQP95238.1 uncharacterized protein Pyn_29241 [Prunus yedoensis var. nudiflora]
MEELRQTVLAYYKDAPQHIKRSVDECFVEMNVDGNDRVSRQEFLAYMKMHEDCKHLSTCSFFNELRKEEKGGLDFMEVVILVYIIYSGKPFCDGHCRSFIKGMYFTCVKCFDGHEHGRCRVPNNTFNVCTACYVDGKICPWPQIVS